MIAQLRDFILDPALHGQGLGRALLDEGPTDELDVHTDWQTTVPYRLFECDLSAEK